WQAEADHSGAKFFRLFAEGVGCPGPPLQGVRVVDRAGIGVRYAHFVKQGRQRLAEDGVTRILWGCKDLFTHGFDPRHVYSSIGSASSAFSKSADAYQ